MQFIRQLWSSRKSFRILLILTLIYAVLRLLIHVAYISGMLAAGDPTKLATPPDLAVYISAAQHLQQYQPLYLDPTSGVKSAFPFFYSPTFALLFSKLFLWLPPVWISFVHSLLHLVAYLALYLLWGNILRRTNQPRATILLSQALPLWLIYAPFWSDLLLLNVRVFITLLVIMLIAALLAEHLASSVLLLVLILLMKPQWACVIALPLLMGQWRFVLKLGALSTVAYALVGALTIIALGPAYGLQQYSDYYRLLAHVADVFPWDLAGSSVFGPNHSITQIAVYFLGITPAAFRLAAGLKLALLLPLVTLAFRHLGRPSKRAQTYDLAGRVDLALALCLAGYIVLDLVWADDFFLGIVIVPYLLATRPAGAWFWLWLLFVLYALVDFMRLAGFAILGQAVIMPTPYIDLVRSDPSIYVPLAMVLILACYTLLLRNLWTRQPFSQSVPVAELEELRLQSGDLASSSTTD
jgi:hypothetical protein